MGSIPITRSSVFQICHLFGDGSFLSPKKPEASDKEIDLHTELFPAAEKWYDTEEKLESGRKESIEKSMNVWRKELQLMLAKEKTVRPPALRRSLEEAYLYATDLPLLLSPEELADFRERAEQAGWQTERKDCWLQLTRTVCKPPDGWRKGILLTEAAACASLLRRWESRKEGKERPDGQREAVLLVKAGETGSKALESVCRKLHGEWAVLLREHRALPEMDLSFFTENGAETGTGSDGSYPDKTDTKRRNEACCLNTSATRNF